MYSSDHNQAFFFDSDGPQGGEWVGGSGAGPRCGFRREAPIIFLGNALKCPDFFLVGGSCAGLGGWGTPWGVVEKA